MNDELREQWEVVAELWPLVATQIRQQVEGAVTRLRSIESTTSLEDVRLIQGEIRGLHAASQIPTRMLEKLK